MKEKEEILNNLVSPRQVQQMFQISRPTEIKWRLEKKLPKPIIMGRRVYYKISDLDNLQDGNLGKAIVS